jgi:hypothetical protein
MRRVSPRELSNAGYQTANMFIRGRRSIYSRRLLLQDAYAHCYANLHRTRCTSWLCMLLRACCVAVDFTCGFQTLRYLLDLHCQCRCGEFGRVAIGRIGTLGTDWREVLVQALSGLIARGNCGTCIGRESSIPPTLNQIHIHKEVKNGLNCAHCHEI